MARGAWWVRVQGVIEESDMTWRLNNNSICARAHTHTHTHTHTHMRLSRSNVHSTHVLNQLLSVSQILVPCGPRAVLPRARPSPVMSLSLYLWFPSAEKIWVLQWLLSCHGLLEDILLSLSQVSAA